MRRTQLGAAALAAALMLGAATAGTAAPPADRGKPKDKAPKNVKVRSLLTRAADGIDDDAKGRIDVHVKNGSRSDLRIHAQRLDAGLLVDFTIEDAGGLEVVVASAVAANGEGSAKLMFKTKQGDTLPLDAASALDLAGRVVRVRANGTDEPILVGRMPAVSEDPRAKLRLRLDLTNDAPETDDNAKGRAEVLWWARDGRCELKIAVAKLAPGAAVSFLMAGSEGVLQEVGTATVGGEGEARLRVRTKQGDALPLDAGDVRDLAGRAIRVDVDGVPQLSGSVPEGG